MLKLTHARMSWLYGLFVVCFFIQTRLYAQVFQCQGIHPSSAFSQRPSVRINPVQLSLSGYTKLDLLAYQRKNQLHITTSAYDIGHPDRMFDGDSLTIMRTAAVNPAQVQLAFSHPQTLHKIRVLLGQPGYPNVDKNSWTVEAAASLSDLNNRTGSYIRLVPLRTGVAGTYDEWSFPQPVQARILRFTITRTLGDNYVHIPELELWGQPDPALEHQFEHVEFTNLVVIYKNTNSGHGPLPETIETDVSIPLRTASEFIFRNSHMSFFSTWNVYVVDDYAPIFNGQDGWIPPGIIHNDLIRRGLPMNIYDCVYVIAAGSYNGAWGTANVLGKAGYFQTGWWGTDYGKYVTVHEYNHIIDAMFASLGFPDYPFNHPDAAMRQGEFVGHGGDNWDVDGDIFRFWGRKRWLHLANEHRWGSVHLTYDNDADGMPDTNGFLPLDEFRLHSSAHSTDTDQDGLTDLQEAMAGKFTAADPTRPDTDNDGLDDALDPFPLYPVHTEVTFKHVAYDSDLSQWPLNGTYYYAHPEHQARTELRLAYDSSFLYVGIRTGASTTGELQLHLDADNNGLFYGKDNLYIIMDNNQIKEVGVRDATQLPDAYIFMPLPSEGYRVRTYTGPNWKTYQLAIPRQAAYGLSLTPEEKIGIWVRVLNYGDVVGADMFEPNDLFEVTLKTGSPLEVRAKGTPASEQNAHFTLFVNHRWVGEQFVTNNYRSYAFPTPFRPDEIRVVDVRFDNDTIIRNQNRNLDIQSIRIGNNTIPALPNNVTYVSSDGDTLPYNGRMSVNGDLFFHRKTPLVVYARGSSVASEYAHFKVFVNNVYLGEAFSSDNYKPYSFEAPFAITNQHPIRIRFDNDWFLNDAQDRNLYVPRIVVGSKTIALTASNTQYIRTNHILVPYTGTMPFDGDLIIQHPLSARWKTDVPPLGDLTQGLILYPNPASGPFTLHMATVPSEPVQVTIRDFTGRQVYATTPMPTEQNTLFIQPGTLKKGLYFVFVQTGASTVIKRLVINE